MMPKNHLHPNLVKTKHISLLTLFSSGGTLICCALPALLVSLGAGAVMASVVSSVPQIVWFSEHKLGVFIFARSNVIYIGFTAMASEVFTVPKR